MFMRNAMSPREYSLLVMLSITHTCQFTTISTAKQQKLLYPNQTLKV